MSKQFLPVLVMTVCLTGCQSSEIPNGGGNAGTTPAVSAAVDEGTQAAATIGDQTITLGELDDYIKEGLFAQQSQNRNPIKLYEMRSSALRQLIDRKVVENAAQAEGVSVEEFLDRSISEIPDEEVNAYYEANRDKLGDATREEVDPRIRSHLKTQKATEYIAKLTADSDSVVLLEPARLEVAAIGPALGPEDAPVTIVEFSDFQCPYCKRVVPTLHQLHEKYADQVRIVFRHLPLDKIHDRARPAAEASACANQQNGFWAFHDKLFEDNRALSDQDFKKYAADIGLDVDAFEKCVTDREFQAVVQADSEAAAVLGLSGTPAFFINGIQIRGAKPIEAFTRIIEAELARRPATAPSG